MHSLGGPHLTVSHYVMPHLTVSRCVMCRPSHPLIRRVTDWNEVEEALAMVAQQCQ